MYSPNHFQVKDSATLAAFMREHSFATIVTHDGTMPHATHMPVLLELGRGEHGTLISHIARANPQWKHFENGEEVLVIFQGPHTYISPAWYVTTPAVPTWNYTAVHAYGVPRIVTDHARFAQMLHDLVEFYESGRAGRWSGEMPEEFRDRLMKGIVGVEIEITRLEGKFKLSQNRPQDAPGVIAGLEATGDPGDAAVARMMRQYGQPCIRKAVAADAEAILRILHDCVAAMRAAGIEQWDEVYPNRDTVMGDIVAGTLDVLCEGDEIGACITVDQNFDPLWEGMDWSTAKESAAAVHRLMVQPSWQGRGCARRLMLHAEEVVKARGLRAIWLDSFLANATAMALYPRLGYRKTGEAMLRKGPFAGFEKLLT